MYLREGKKGYYDRPKVFFERGIWFKDKACSFDPGGGVLLYVEHWAGLRNAVIGAKNRSKNCRYCIARR